MRLTLGIATSPRRSLLPTRLRCWRLLAVAAKQRIHSPCEIPLRAGKEREETAGMKIGTKRGAVPAEGPRASRLSELAAGGQSVHSGTTFLLAAANVAGFRHGQSGDSSRWPLRRKHVSRPQEETWAVWKS